MATKSYFIYSKSPSVSPAETFKNFRGFLQSKGEEIPISCSCDNGMNYDLPVRVYHLISGITAVLDSPKMVVEQITFSGKIKDIGKIVSETKSICKLEEKGK